MLGPVKTWLNENSAAIAAFPLKPAQIAALIDTVDSGKVSFSIASTKLFHLLLQEPGETPIVLAEKNNLIQQSNAADLEPVIDAVLEKLSGKVAEYKKGKKACWRFLWAR